MAKSIDVCEIHGCNEVPQKGETICSSCWNAHDSYNLPGFPSDFDDLSEEDWALVEKAENYEADKASGDLESYDYRAEDVEF